MSIVCGVDGCKNGWVVVAKDLRSGVITWSSIQSFRELANHFPAPQVIAVDIPIGLPASGSRECDVEARRLLGKPRSSSVFPAPIRPVLKASSYKEASSLRFQAESKKMSQQAWAIVPKIIEVDRALREKYFSQVQVREIHPEVCFYHLSGGRPMFYGKKTSAGKMERLAILKELYNDVPAALADKRRLKCSTDDVLDAFAALWTAERIVSGEFGQLPLAPPNDGNGLRMEIVF